MKPIAVLTFIVASSGKMPLRTGRSNIQPKMTAQPIKAIAMLIFLEKDWSEVLKVEDCRLGCIFKASIACFNFSSCSIGFLASGECDRSAQSDDPAQSRSLGERLHKDLAQRSVAIALAMRSSAIANYCDYAIEPLVSDRVASRATHTDFSNTLSSQAGALVPACSITAWNFGRARLIISSLAVIDTRK